jgi:predicted acylesterase/phospholipase RssA
MGTYSVTVDSQSLKGSVRLLHWQPPALLAGSAPSRMLPIRDNLVPVSSIYRTQFYSDCLGVFQGGGCRAAAFAGAYEAAYRSGVRFSEVAGTSAGAIVAALVAAGAEPDYLLKELREFNFIELLETPKQPFFPSRLGRWATPLAQHFSGETATIVCAALSGGLHSSAKIAEWIETRLQALLRLNKGPVQFGDLVLPLYVVASDLTTMKARVWSTTETPTLSVAHAVRASCSIPLYFQPVEEGSTLLVDGGLVSNLPLFVFASRSNFDQPPGRRTLSFALEADQSTDRPRDAKTYLRKLIGLTIDGGTDVQLRFQPDMAKITIPTGTIQATDFESMDATKVETLIENGRVATNSFLRHELLGTRSGTLQSKSIFDEHQAFQRLTDQLTAVRKQAIISFSDTKWFWDLFPTVFYWLRQGVQVHCFTLPLNQSLVDSAKEMQRRHLMTQMGVLLYERGDVPFRGFMIDNGTDATSSALVFAADRFDYEPIAQHYEARTDATVLAALYDKLRPILNPSPPTVSPLLMEAAPEQELVGLLKNNVRQYRNAKVQVTVEVVDVSKVLLISRYVRAFRYQQISTLVDALGQNKLDLFQPARIRLADGGFSIVTPPVYEAVDDQYVAIEGNTRSLYCLNNNIAAIKALVVRGTNEPLPGRPIPLRQVRITGWRHRPEERIEGFNRDLFRDIERAVRPLA